MSDFIETIQQQFKERLTSPLSGAFVISWALINYKFMLVLFSDLKPWVKIGFIKNQIFPDPTAVAIYGIAAPLAASLAYILIYPHPARWVLKYSLSQKRRAKEVRHAADNLTPMTRDEIDAEIAPLRAKIGKLQTEIDQKDAIIDRSKEAKERDDNLLAQYAAKLADAATEKKGNERTINELQSTLEDKEAEISTIKNDLINVEGLFAGHSIQSEEEITALKRKIEELEGSLKIANLELEKLQKHKNKNASTSDLSSSIAKVNSLSDGLILSNKNQSAMDSLTKIHKSAIADLASSTKHVELARQVLEKTQSDRQTAEIIAAARQALAASQLETDN